MKSPMNDEVFCYRFQSFCSDVTYAALRKAYQPGNFVLVF